MLREVRGGGSRGAHCACAEGAVTCGPARCVDAAEPFPVAAYVINGAEAGPKA